MPQMTIQQFVDMLLERPGSTILTLHSTTPQKDKLKVKWFNEGGSDVFLQQEVNGNVNYRYEDAVNRQRAREGRPQDFVAEPRQWGERIPHTPFVKHRDNFYVTVKIRSTKVRGYVDGPLTTGNRIDKPADEYWRARSNSSRQGVDNQVITRDFRLDHVTAVTIRGEKHDIVQGPVVIPE